MTGSRSLQNHTDERDTTSTPDENGSAAEAVSGVSREEGAKETSGLESADDVGTQVGPLVIRGVLRAQSVQAAGCKCKLVTTNSTARESTYSWNSGILKTPPMAPVSIPKIKPPKQACRGGQSRERGYDYG